VSEKSVVRRFLREAGSLWLRAEHVKEGDRVFVERVDLDEESWDRPYIVVTGTLERLGEVVKVRLGVKNVQRIVETLGDDERGWIGNFLEVIGTESYKGLGRRGILWRGMKVEVKLSPATLNWIGDLPEDVRRGEAPIPAEAWNEMPSEVKTELMDKNLLEERYGYPYVSKRLMELLR